ncbi:hypothetical protein [Variovorax sp. PBL-E5]|uniref:hypothetical protein n=1 Tax=Variovorax sp. PBL-E5 TaxID=434014 RepID=UPI0013A59B2E|nr:hypothetical protein [Variovorax sp. PBL-E5]
MADSKAEVISQIQALAEEERIAHPEEDEAAISAALDLIEERVRARRVARQRSRVMLVAAAVVGTLALALALWPCRSKGRTPSRK